MGHIRLGTLPDTRPWNRVVALIADGETAAVIAKATSEAACGGLARGKSDPGLVKVIHLLAHTVLAARQHDSTAALSDLGIELPEEPGLYDLTGGFAAAVRDWHRESRVRQTDLGEMAELAAVEALTRCVGDRCDGLFPSGGEVMVAARSFSTAKGFSHLAHEFFSRFTQRFLLYHLGRELPLHVGGGGRFANPAAQTRFIDDLDLHTREAAMIVKKYAGEWYSKAKFTEGISKAQAQKFAAYCLTKLGSELGVRGGRDD